MDLALSRELQKALSRMIQRRLLAAAQARGIALSLDHGEVLARLVPRRALGRSDDRTERHVERGSPTVLRRPRAELGDALLRRRQRLAEHREYIAMPRAHHQRALRRAAEEQRRVRLLQRAYIRARAANSIEL